MSVDKSRSPSSWNLEIGSSVVLKGTFGPMLTVIDRGGDRAYLAYFSHGQEAFNIVSFPYEALDWCSDAPATLDKAAPQYEFSSPQQQSAQRPSPLDGDADEVPF